MYVAIIAITAMSGKYLALEVDISPQKGLRSTPEPLQQLPKHIDLDQSALVGPTH